jgi:hypothetical protein
LGAKVRLINANCGCSGRLEDYEAASAILAKGRKAALGQPRGPDRKLTLLERPLQPVRRYQQPAILRDAMHGKHGWPRLHWLNVGGSPCDSMGVSDCRSGGCCMAFMMVPSGAEIIGCISARGIMSYDMRVYKLVELFLSEVPEKNTAKNRHLLAQHLQDELEDWILFMLLPDRREDVYPGDGL